jgi:hypothetical protein
MAFDDDQIKTWFNGKSISRADVHAWESKRLNKNLRKFGVKARDGELTELRTALATAKVNMGRAKIERRLAREVRISDSITGMLARASRGRRRLSQVEMFVPGARADQLPAWYLANAEADDEIDFLSATPDHHLFRLSSSPNFQEVWETTGGTPVCSRFFIELDSTDGLVTPPDPNYPVQMTGCARLANGTVLGGIRHQFRDENDGAHVLLTVEFPWLIGPYGPAAHRWHLASEFANWIQAAAIA